MDHLIQIVSSTRPSKTTAMCQNTRSATTHFGQSEGLSCAQRTSCKVKGLYLMTLHNVPTLCPMKSVLVSKRSKRNMCQIRTGLKPCLSIMITTSGSKALLPKYRHTCVVRQCKSHPPGRSTKPRAMKTSGAGNQSAPKRSYGGLPTPPPLSPSVRRACTGV